MNAVVGMVVGDAAQYFVNDLHDQVVYLQLAARTGEYQAGNIIMQELRFGCCFVDRGMQVIVRKELCAAILFQQGSIKGLREFKDGAFIGHTVRMGHRALIAGFGDQHTAGIRIQ